MQINGVKTRYWIVFSALVSFSSAKSLTRTVEPISINDGIWTVLSRIGVAFDTMSPCMFGIQQTDMPITITNPGYYCFNQDLTFTATGITISTNNVIVDFNSRTLDGTSGTNGVGVLLTNGVQNTVIRNGVIQNVSGAAGTGIGNMNDGLTLDNIVIQDMSFINFGFNAIELCSNTAGFDVLGVIIERCNSYNAGGFRCCGNDVVMRNCVINSPRSQTDTAGCIFVEGSPSVLGKDVLIEECSITSTFGNGNGCQITIERMFNAETLNCSVDGGVGAAFGFTDIQNLVVSGCTARFADSGFTFTNPIVTALSIVFEDCVAQANTNQGFQIVSTATIQSLAFVDCVARAVGLQGFILTTANAGAGSILNVLMSNCTVELGSFGIFVTMNGAGLLQNFVFDNCIVQNCASSGFRLDSQLGYINNVVFRNCIAQQNGDDGFIFLNNVSNGLLEGCISQRNTGTGFTFASTTTFIEMVQCRALANGGVGVANNGIAANYILGCTSLSNGGLDYVGITDTTQIVSNSQLGAVAAATFWQNIKT